MRGGLEFLTRTQRDDGDWAEPWHTWVVHHDGLYWRDTILRDPAFQSIQRRLGSLSPLLPSPSEPSPEGVTRNGPGGAAATH